MISCRVGATCGSSSMVANSVSWAETFSPSWNRHTGHASKCSSTIHPKHGLAYTVKIWLYKKLYGSTTRQKYHNHSGATSGLAMYPAIVPKSAVWSSLFAHIVHCSAGPHGFDQIQKIAWDILNQTKISGGRTHQVPLANEQATSWHQSNMERLDACNGATPGWPTGIYHNTPFLSHYAQHLP